MFEDFDFLAMALGCVSTLLVVELIAANIDDIYDYKIHIAIIFTISLASYFAEEFQKEELLIIGDTENETQLFLL